MRRAEAPVLTVGNDAAVVAFGAGRTCCCRCGAWRGTSMRPG